MVDDLNRRILLLVAQDLTILERARLGDPKKDLRETFDLIERALRIKRLMHEACPKRARKKRNQAGRKNRGR